MKTNRFTKFYKSGPHFRIENPNPRWNEQRGLVWHVGDCVIRALANSIGCSWLDAFDYLTSRARRDFSVPNDGKDLRKWLTESGAIWNPCVAKSGKKRLTVLEFAETHPTGRFILRVASHECAVVDGVVLDAWNPGAKTVYGFFDMENFSLNV